MKTSQHGIDLIKEYEGFRARAYRDPVGIWTIGYGFTEGVEDGDTTTRAEADARLQRELVKYERAVLRATGGNVTQNQFDALVCWAYNVGTRAAQQSTLMRLLNAGDVAGAADQFLRWNKAGGVPLPGLTRRREAERELFLED